MSFDQPMRGEDATSLVEASDGIRTIASQVPHLAWVQRFAAAVDDAAQTAVDEELDGLAADGSEPT